MQVAPNINITTLRHAGQNQNQPQTSQRLWAYQVTGLPQQTQPNENNGVPQNHVKQIYILIKIAKQHLRHNKQSLYICISNFNTPLKLHIHIYT